MHSYRIIRVLQQDPFNIHYLAEEINQRTPVVIKECFPRKYVRRTEGVAEIKAQSAEAGKRFKWITERFLLEMRMLSRLKHPNIVRILDIIKENNTVYTVTYHENGVSLADLLERRHTLSEKTLTKILVPILGALEKIHASGLLHRDIKPSNIYIREDGSPVLLNFCSVYQPAKDLSHGYAPIELYSGKKESQGPWTDIYAMGATLYQAVTGEIPSSAVERRSASTNGQGDPLVLVSELVSELMLKACSKDFLEAIDHALAYRVQDRPQNIATWRRELICDGTPDSAAQLGARRACEVITDDEKGKLADRIIGQLMDEVIETEGEKPDGGQNNAQRASRESPAFADEPEPEQDDLLAQFGRYRDASAFSEHHEDPTGPVVGDGSSDAICDTRRTQSPSTAEELDALLLNMRPAGPQTKAGEYTDTRPVLRRRRIPIGLMWGLLFVTAGVMSGVLVLDQLDNPIQMWRTMSTTPETESDIKTVTNTHEQPAEERSEEERSDQSKSAVAIIQPAHVPAAPEDKATPADEATPPVDKSEAESLSSPKPASSREPIDIETKLAAAREDFAARRLTTPVDNNAYEKYQAILEQDPDNQAARAGLQKILDFYIHIARNSMEEGRFEHAQTMLQRAATVDPQATELLRAHDDLDRQRAAAHLDSSPDTAQRDLMQQDNPASPPSYSQETDNRHSAPSPPLPPTGEHNSGRATVPSPPLPPTGDEEIHRNNAPSPPISSY